MSRVISRLQADARGDYLRELLDKDFTDEQMAIITAELTPQLVIAGAGSGKTMVMAARIVHAVAHHRVAPSRILGLTFTNKAAGELAERVRQCLDRLATPVDDQDVDDIPTVATYNSYAAQIVRDHALRIGREPGATLLTEAVQWQLAMRVVTRAPGPFGYLTWTSSYVAELIVALAGELSDHLATADDVRRHDARVRAEIAALPNPVKPAREIVDRTFARDELLDWSRLTPRRRSGSTSSTSATRWHLPARSRRRRRKSSRSSGPASSLSSWMSIRTPEWPSGSC